MYSEVMQFPSLENFNSVIHISHDDLDGISPIILSRIAFKGKSLVECCCGYDKVDETVSNMIECLDRNAVMIITDISPSPELLSRICEKVCDGYFIILIDHHDPKTNDVENYRNWMVLCKQYPDGRCTAATSMYYDYLLKNGVLDKTPALDDFVELVRLYDTWEWAEQENQRAKHLNDYLFMIGKEKFMEEILVQLERGGQFFQLDEKAEFVLSIEQRRIQDYCQTKKKQLRLFRGTVDDTGRIYTYGVLFAEMYVSELGNFLLKEYPEMDFVVMIDPGKMKMSLRSRKGSMVDVGSIARYFQGGGREATAGCPLNGQSKYQFLDRLLVF